MLSGVSALNPKHKSYFDQQSLLTMAQNFGITEDNLNAELHQVRHLRSSSGDAWSSNPGLLATNIKRARALNVDKIIDAFALSHNNRCIVLLWVIIFYYYSHGDGLLLLIFSYLMRMIVCYAFGLHFGVFIFHGGTMILTSIWWAHMNVFQCPAVVFWDGLIRLMTHAACTGCAGARWSNVTLLKNMIYFILSSFLGAPPLNVEAHP